MTALRMFVVALVACGGAPAPRAPAPAAPHAFRVEVAGSGPPMILIPGLASSGQTWDSTVAHLRARYTCHVLTLAGFAGVPAIAEPLRPAVEAELARYIAEHHLVKPVLVGHSLGGELALDFAAEHPDQVGALVIVDSLPFLGGVLPGVDSEAAARPMLDRMRASLEEPSAEQYAAYVRAGTSTRPMVTGDADHERIVGWSLASDRATVTGAMLDLMATDLRPKLARVAAPALVIGTWVGWAAAPAERPEYLDRFRAQYAGLRRMHFAMTDTARHFVMLDDLPWFLGQLDGFLANPDAAVRDRGV